MPNASRRNPCWPPPTWRPCAASDFPIPVRAKALADSPYDRKHWDSGKGQGGSDALPAHVAVYRFTPARLDDRSGRRRIGSDMSGFTHGSAHGATTIGQGAEPPNGTAQVEKVVDGLQHPWVLALLPDNEGILITERPGRLRLWRDGRLSEPLLGVPEVYAKGQGGLLDVALAPDFAQNRRVFLGYAEQGDRGAAGTAVGVGVLSDDASSIREFKVIFRQQPKLSSGAHFGVRLVFDRTGHLFIALGENNQRSTAQDLDKHQGKLVRLNTDGSVPADNPFVGQEGALPEIWSYGHRNQQGAALNPWSGQVWTHEHGA